MWPMVSAVLCSAIYIVTSLPWPHGKVKLSLDAHFRISAETVVRRGNFHLMNTRHIWYTTKKSRHIQFGREECHRDNCIASSAQARIIQESKKWIFLFQWQAWFYCKFYSLPCCCTFDKYKVLLKFLAQNTLSTVITLFITFVILQKPANKKA